MEAEDLTQKTRLLIDHMVKKMGRDMAKDMGIELEELDPNDCGGCETCDQVFGPNRGRKLEVEPLKIPEFWEIDMSKLAPHKCRCPSENFSINGAGCVCGGQ